MMLSVTRLKQISLHAFFCGICLFGNTSFAQDVAKSNTSADSKIRNIDGVAAVVNTGYVTRKEIDDRIAALKKQGVKLPEDGSVRKVIMDRLILEKFNCKTPNKKV